MACKEKHKTVSPSINTLILFIVCLATTGIVKGENTILLSNKGHYMLEYSCSARTAIYFRYKAFKDVGQHSRINTFTIDPLLPQHCSQYSTGSYKRQKGVLPTFDRGHLVPQNHLDHSVDAMRISNRMSNVVPMESSLNRRGLWRYTEKLIECYRDKGGVEVHGGVIIGSNDSNDYFLRSHGIKTPDQLWKVIKRADGQYQAWLMPNSSAGKNKKMWNKYVIDIETLSAKTGRDLQKLINPKEGVTMTKKIWPLPSGCDLS